MQSDNSIIVDLVHRVNAMAQRNWMQPDESIEVFRDNAFEEFLIKVNQGVALCSSAGYFFYVSRSMVNILGYPRELLYEKGPSLLHDVITPADKRAVEKMLTQSEQSVQQSVTPSGTIRISFDYHIVSGKGDIKRIYQHTLPSAVVYERKFYTLFILSDLTGFKSSPLLNYSVSYLTSSDRFETIAEGTMGAESPYRLTRSEEEIVRKLAEGKSMKEIGDLLFISQATLKTHRNNILKKTGAKNMVALIEDGYRRGWIYAPLSSSLTRHSKHS